MLRYFVYSILYVVLAACQPAPEPEKPKGLLRIATVPLDMPIIVNGQPKGNSPSGEGQYFSISLQEGEHTIEILKPIDLEKDQYTKKVIFIAADTIPIVTLEAIERLTPLGEQEKARREIEVAKQASLDEMARIEKREVKRKKNKAYESFLNNVEINVPTTHVGDKYSISFKVDNCSMLVKEVGNEYSKIAKVNARDLMEESPFFTISSDVGPIKFWSIQVKCKDRANCASYRLSSNGNNETTSDSLWFVNIRSDQQPDSGVEGIKKISAAFESIVRSCQ